MWIISVTKVIWGAETGLLFRSSVCFSVPKWVDKRKCSFWSGTYISRRPDVCYDGHTHTPSGVCDNDYISYVSVTDCTGSPAAYSTEVKLFSFILKPYSAEVVRHVSIKKSNFRLIKRYNRATDIIYWLGSL